jgi:hypothetical protein
MKSIFIGTFVESSAWEEASYKRNSSSLTIQISSIIVERHPTKMGIKMWIIGRGASAIQGRPRV